MPEVTDPHAPKEERTISHSMMPIIKVLTEEDQAAATEALKALTAISAAEQKTEDAVNAAASPVDSAAYDNGKLEMEAAVDHALAVSRALQGRFKASSEDSRNRRMILAILRGDA